MKRLALAALLIAPISTGVTMAQETIGPWTIHATPVAASEVTAFIDPSDWLNIVDAAVTVPEAYTGFSMVAAGFANLATNTVIEVSFAAAIENVAGPELVLFDGRFDDGSYAVSSDYDGFVAELTIADVAFTDSGETRVYYFGNAPGTPFTTGVWGSEIDLTNLGLPIGGMATTFRFRSTNGATDALGLGSLNLPVPVELQAFTIE